MEERGEGGGERRGGKKKKSEGTWKEEKRQGMYVSGVYRYARCVCARIAGGHWIRPSTCRAHLSGMVHQGSKEASEGHSSPLMIHGGQRPGVYASGPALQGRAGQRA